MIVIEYLPPSSRQEEHMGHIRIASRPIAPHGLAFDFPRKHPVEERQNLTQGVNLVVSAHAGESHSLYEPVNRQVRVCLGNETGTAEAIQGIVKPNE